MKRAISEAKKTDNDIPIGCIIELEGKVISSAHNLREKNKDITAHAEIIAIKEAQEKLGTSRLNACKMYVTLEPCPMCAWAIIQSGIKTLYFGSYNLQYGAIQSVLNLPKIANSKIKVYGGIMEEDCNLLLEDFFKKLREKNDNKTRT